MVISKENCKHVVNERYFGRTAPTEHRLLYQSCFSAFYAVISFTVENRCGVRDETSDDVFGVCTYRIRREKGNSRARDVRRGTGRACDEKVTTHGSVRVGNKIRSEGRRFCRTLAGHAFATLTCDLFTPSRPVRVFSSPPILIPDDGRRTSRAFTRASGEEYVRVEIDSAGPAAIVACARPGSLRADRRKGGLPAAIKGQVRVYASEAKTSAKAGHART